MKNIRKNDSVRTKNILILETRVLSYSSSHVFLSEIATQLEKMGFTVQHVIITDIEKESGELEKFIGKSFTAVIDINSHLPLANLDMVPYPDLIDAPFVNIFVDHPLHLHPILNVKLKNGVAVCVDRHHAEYVRRFYPFFKKVISIPLAGTKSERNISFKNRRHDVLFAGTYTPSNYFLEQMDSQTRSVAYDVREYIGEHKKDMSKLSFPDIFCTLYGKPGEMFAMQMYKLRSVERYIRELKREKVITALLESGVALTVFGARWDMFKTKYQKNITINNEIEYRKMADEMADCRVVLNIQPFFADSVHDRVSTALANGCVCLSDACGWLDGNLKDGKEYICYHMDSLYEDFDRLHGYLEDGKRLEEMAACARKNVSDSINWENYCNKLFDIKNTDIYDD